MIAGAYVSRGTTIDAVATRLVDADDPDVRSWRNSSCVLFQQDVDAPGQLSGFPFAETGLAVTACGRLDNLGEVAGLLGLAEATSPARVLLASYTRWGEGMASRLQGDFAIAVLDQRAGLLYLARDRLGVVPFYFARTPWGAAFALSPTYLLRLPSVTRELDESRVVSYLADLPNDQTSTFYRDVHAVPPAHTICLRDAETQTRRYWRLNPDPELSLADSHEYADEFRKRFVRAVERCTSGTERIAICLSGGLDSSSIACTAAKLLGKRVDSFTAVFPELPSCDEREYVEQVVSAAQATATYTQLTPETVPDPWEIAPKLADPTLLGMYPIMWPQLAAARAGGHRVVLAGSLGDIVGGGAFNVLDELFARRRFRQLGRELRLMQPGAALRAGIQTAAWGVAPSAFRAVKRSRDHARLRLRFPSLKYVSSEMQKKHAVVQRLLDLDVRRPATSVRQDVTATLSSVWAETELNVLWTSATLNGVVPRHPFADVELLEWSVRLPLDARRRNGMGRWILREAMAGLLPDPVRLRRKKTFFDGYYQRVIPLWLQHMSRTCWDTGYLDLAQFVRALDAPLDYYELRAIWTCGTFLVWLEHEARHV